MVFPVCGPGGKGTDRMRTPRGFTVSRWAGFACLVLVAVGRPAVAVDKTVLEAERARIATIEKVAPSVVAIFSSKGGGGGSGVLISADGYALSNFHVTSACGEFMKCGLNDGKLYDAVIVGIDPTGDVALIKMLGRDDFPVATLGDSDQLKQGDWVYVMGNPFLLATDFAPTVTYGIVSGVHRYQYPAGTILEYTDCIQTDASINPGNSGGPLFNSAGELVGINGRGSFEKRGRVNVGAGYAISINQIKHFLDHLKSGRIVDHATLGATVRTDRLSRAVVVDSILPQSEAFRRGLREGDEIVSFAGRPIGSVNQFKNILGIYPDGWTVPLVYRREEQKTEIYVRLRPLHHQSELAETQGPKVPDPRQPPHPGPDGGPMPPPGEAAKDDLDADLKKLYEGRPGYANYYFNRQHQSRLEEGLKEFAGWDGRRGTWKFSGVTDANQTFRVLLAEQSVGMWLDDKPYLQPLDAVEWLDEPPGTGGLLVAFQQFKWLVSEGPEAFTEFAYFGSEPLDGRGPLVDVLLTERGTLGARWYFRQSDGALIGYDSSLLADQDECRIRFVETAAFSGLRFPATFSVSSGDKQLGVFKVQQVEPPAK